MGVYHKPILSAAVLGAGTMGAQIAAHLANAGLKVQLLDLPAPEGPRNSAVNRNLKAATKAKPNPFFTRRAVANITTGNFEDDFDRIGEADWVIESVVEWPSVKRQIFKRVERYARSDAIVSTNTSGIPIAGIVEGRSLAFRKRVLGTHFFNPPRYLELLELIPTADTDPEVVDRIAAFGRVHLGKGIVVAKDVPYFIGNRIGVYAMLGAIEYYTKGQYTIEEIDTLTGPLTGRPRSATFRTADLVGLDVIKDIGKQLYEALPNDESRERFMVSPVISSLVDNGALGAKTRKGFYQKKGRKILSLDRHSGEYGPPIPLNIGDLSLLKKAGALPQRLRALYADEGRAGLFFREITLDTLGYAARRVGEICDNPGPIDQAMRWGFGWELGPFEIWDALGFDRVRSDMVDAGIPLPPWVMAMPNDGAFYQNGSVLVPSTEKYIKVSAPEDEINLASVRSQPSRTLWSNEEAGLLDIGDGVALFEFRSKANTMGQRVIHGLMEAIDLVENHSSLRGMVIGNEGKHFSVGANLKEMAGAVAMKAFDQIDDYIARFQQALQRVHYAAKPVVVAMHQRALGGGCELVMSSTNPVAAAESYIGLVEVGVGLIPAGTGCMRLAARASASHAGHDSDLLAHLRHFFERVAKGEVATSAAHARELGYLLPHVKIVMRSARRLHVAKQTVVGLSEQGYMPPVPDPIRVLGKPGYAALQMGILHILWGGYASDYDRHLAERVAYVMTGGDLSGAQDVTEQYMLDLERTEFLKLLQNPLTQERITGMLSGKPVRN